MSTLGALRKPLPVLQKYSFKRIFGHGLNQCWHPLFGFEMSHFERLLGVPEDQSISDYVEQEYGQEAVDLILKLIEL